MISAAEAARASKSFIDFDIVAIDTFYDGFTSGPLEDAKGNWFYAVMQHEDQAPNPKYDPEVATSRSILYYRIYALYELTEEEWSLWKKAHDLFAEYNGRHSCRKCGHEPDNTPNMHQDNQRKYWDTDLREERDAMIESLSTRDPYGWATAGKYFDPRRVLIEQN